MLGQDTEALSRCLDARIVAAADQEALAREFASATPFPHVVIPDFFRRDLAEQLLDDFPPFDERHAPGEMRRGGKKATRRDVRALSAAFAQLDDFIQGGEFLGLMSQISGIPDLLYDPEYHGGGTHDNIEGASLYTHIDFNYHPKGWHRRLNLIVYLTPGWEYEWGGHLELHSNPWDTAQDEVRAVPTRFNQAILFETSERSWHGFGPITLPQDQRHVSRKSFAIYLYTKDRPAEQTAARHSTLYVPFGLPQEIRAGITLTQEQHDLLEARFGEYRQMLRYQYERQQRLSEELAAGYRLQIQGYAVQPRAPLGCWTDGWVTSELNVELIPTRAVSGVQLEIAVPKKLEHHQTLTMRVGRATTTASLAAGETQVIHVPVALSPDERAEIVVHASSTFTPSGDDNRQLAYRIERIVLEH